MLYGVSNGHVKARNLRRSFGECLDESLNKVVTLSQKKRASRPRAAKGR